MKSLTFCHALLLGESTSISSMEIPDPPKLVSILQPSVPGSDSALSSTPTTLSVSTGKAPLVSLISAAAYTCAIQQKDSIQFTIWSQRPKAQGQSSVLTPADLKGLPPEYSEYADIFNKQEAFTLPPHHGDFNLQIKTQNNEVPPIGDISIYFRN
jgi:hypothetical protein